MKRIIPLIITIFVTSSLFGQDTLPKFTLTERGDRVTISWTNPYHGLTQLNVQRSFDSLRNFTTIFSAPSPQLPQNGYTDTRPASNRYYYRIFFAQEGGAYFFTMSKRSGSTASTSTVTTSLKEVPASRDLVAGMLAKIGPNDKRNITIKIKDAVIKKLPVSGFLSFRDSVLRQTKDTLYAINDSVVGIGVYVPIQAYRTSAYVYINKDGFVNISLPLVNEKKYSIKFFEENGTPLFELYTVKESPLMLDKANFVHAGWFLFELYEDNKLKEKNKLFIPKDF